MEVAARRIVAYARWRKRHAEGGASFPRPAIDVLEAHIGGFNLSTIRLAKRAVKRAREIQDTARPEGVVPKRRRVSSIPEYAPRRDLERLVPL